MSRLIALLIVLFASATCIGEPGNSRDYSSVLDGKPVEDSTDWIDYGAMDHSTPAVDDFYQFVSGRWLEETVIPETVPWIAPYVENYFEVQGRLEGIIVALASQADETDPDERRVGDFYRSYMNVDAVEALGLSPLEPVLSAIDEVESTDDLAELFAEFNRKHFRHTDTLNRYAVPFVITVRPDDRDASQLAVILRPAGLGMSTRESYIANDEGQRQMRAQYLGHVERVLDLAGTPESAVKAASILALETRLAAATLSLTARMDHGRNYNKLARSELKQLAPNLNWALYLDSAGLGEQDAFLVPDTGYFRALNALFESTPLEEWKAYLRWQLLRIYSPYLPAAFSELDFAFFERVEKGNEEPLTREDQATLIVEQAFPELLGRLYVDRYFSAEAKSDVTEMAHAIREQFRMSIQDLDWMSDETKQAALDKLAKIDIKIGYPSQWRNYDGLVIDSSDLIGNLMRINAADYQRRTDSVGKPVDRSVWQTPAYASNAYYYRVMNELVIPAGYLLPPWYDIDAEPAMNYGGIGTVIGHEIGHAFDNQGSEYDGDGNLNDWWTEGDHRRFVERTDRLVAQYNQYSPAPGKYVDGALTLSENIGDLTGVTMAYRAFQAATSETEVPAVAGFTGEQRFFISYAAHWRALYRDALLDRILASDGHPPQKYRANGPLVNFSPFYKAFNVTQGDGMYLPEDQRVSIW